MVRLAFSFSVISLISNQVVMGSVMGSFLLSRGNPWYGGLTVCLASYSLKGFWVVSDLGCYKYSCFQLPSTGFFVSITSVVKSKNSLPVSKFQRFSSLSFSKSFIVLCFKRMIPCARCEVEVKVLPVYGYLIFPAPFLEKVILLSLN